MYKLLKAMYKITRQAARRLRISNKVAGEWWQSQRSLFSRETAAQANTMEKLAQLSGEL